MSSFFAFRRSPSPEPVRAFVGLAILILSAPVAYLFSYISHHREYTASTYTEVLIREWFIASVPIFLSLVPALFLALMEVFQHIRWKRLAIYSLLGGVIVTLPFYDYMINRWRPLSAAVSGLPVESTGFHRHIDTGALGWGYDIDVSMGFIIPAGNYPSVNQTIQSKIKQYNSAFNEYHYSAEKLENGDFAAWIGGGKRETPYYWH